MNALESVVVEVEALDRVLSRRRFLLVAALIGVAPTANLDDDTDTFLRGVAATLVPEALIRDSGIDVAANVRHLLERARHDHRRQIVRLITWARRISFLYGGERIAIGARGSRFVLVQKLGRALASICLVAFWGDPRALGYIDIPPASVS
jgi:hypothetical protein